MNAEKDKKMSINEFLPLLTDNFKEKEIEEITDERREELMKIAMDRAAIFNKIK